MATIGFNDQAGSNARNPKGCQCSCRLVKRRLLRLGALGLGAELPSSCSLGRPPSSMLLDQVRRPVLQGASELGGRIIIACQVMGPPMTRSWVRFRPRPISSRKAPP